MVARSIQNEYGSGGPENELSPLMDWQIYIKIVQTLANMKLEYPTGGLQTNFTLYFSCNLNSLKCLVLICKYGLHKATIAYMKNKLQSNK